ncbi:MAG: hypothetical protein QOD28_819 [Acidobacteriota bacterium]|nr:hypothetical protein [Acidobacteriota bacterium]
MSPSPLKFSGCAKRAGRCQWKAAVAVYCLVGVESFGAGEAEEAAAFCRSLA